MCPCLYESSLRPWHISQRALAESAGARGQPLTLATSLCVRLPPLPRRQQPHCAKRRAKRLHVLCHWPQRRHKGSVAQLLGQAVYVSNEVWVEFVALQRRRPQLTTLIIHEARHPNPLHFVCEIPFWAHWAMPWWPGGPTTNHTSLITPSNGNRNRKLNRHRVTESWSHRVRITE